MVQGNAEPETYVYICLWLNQPTAGRSRVQRLKIISYIKCNLTLLSISKRKSDYIQNLIQKYLYFFFKEFVCPIAPPFFPICPIGLGPGCATSSYRW